MKYEKANPVSIKSHNELDEKWLQGPLAEDPGLLGLGELELKDVGRRQPRAGRRDLPFTDPEIRVRYEVEVQLGATDEAHIIRTVEYWGIGRPGIPSTNTWRCSLQRTSPVAF